MASIYGTSSGSRRRSRRSIYADRSTGYEDILRAAQEKGYDPKPKVGMMTRLGNVLSSFEPGGELATLVRTGDVGKAGGQYVEEVLRGLGSALPFLDKYTKPTKLAEEREGYAELLEELGVPEGELKVGSKRVGSLRGAAGLAGDIVLDPGNLLLAGLFKTAGKGVKGGGRVAGRALAKTDAGRDVLKILSQATETGKEAFVPAYKASKVSPEAVDLAKTTKKMQRMGDIDTAKMVKELVEKHGLKKFRKVPEEIERWGIAKEAGEKAPKLSDAAQDTMKLIKKTTGGEIPAGLRKTDLDAYFPRIAKKTPDVSVDAPGGFSSKLGKAGYDPTKSRIYKTLKEGREAGVEYLEPEYALTQRLMSSQKAQKAKGAINQMVVGSVKDVDGGSILKPLKKGELLDDYVPIILDKNGIKVGEKTIGFYPEVSKAGKKIVGVTTKKARYQMHKDVADYMTNVQKVFGSEEATASIIKLYDNTLNLWKASVTGPFPAFHIRNMVSNIFNNFVGGVKDPIRYADAAKIQKGKGKLAIKLKKYFPDDVKTYDHAREYLDKLGVRGWGQFSVEVDDELLQLMGRSKTFRPAGKILSGGRKVGTMFEDNARIAHYFDKLNKGLTSDEAVKSVNKFLFDYSDLSKFETEFLKRIFPFYTWTRKNLPLQIEQIYKQPVKYKAILDTVRAFQGGDLTDEEKRYLPDYLKERFGIPLSRSESGFPQILSGMDLPVEGLEFLGDPGKKSLDLLSPLVKTPVEMATGQSFFYGRPIKSTSAYNSTTKAIGGIPLLKQFLNAKETKNKAGQTYYRVDPEKMYILKAIAGRFIGSGEKLTDQRKDALMRIFNFATGLRIYTPDIDREKERQILEMLRELNLTSTFEREYVPASVKEELGVQ